MTAQEETRNGFLVTSERKRLWMMLMEMVEKLLEVCKKHDIKIWADAGTLLGVIRHKGFIPWDDDIDLIMMREDYERLLKVAPQEFKHPYFFQAVETDPYYYRGHAQLRRSDTTAILPCFIWEDFNQGVFIDIFIMDDLPSTEDQRKVAFADMEKIRDTLNFAHVSFLSRRPLKVLHADREIRKAGGLVNQYHRMLEVLWNHPDKHDKEMACVGFNTWQYPRIKMNKDYYSGTVYMPFEDIQLPVPTGYHDVLSRLYGDYMTPKEVPSMHGSIILDLERPYTEVLPELRKKAPLIDKLKYSLRLKRYKP
ncbi:MAG: LicD family protein [Muribaculaceae bacterium]|nr:LicD family protein [Muribaculaceae bacterium]